MATPTLPRLHHQRGCSCPSCHEWREYDAAQSSAAPRRTIDLPFSYEDVVSGAAREKARLASEMPTEQDAIDAIYRGYSRLKELGWRDGLYMPKDGTPVTVMQVGSTGSFTCRYWGEWPDGFFNLEDGGDIYPSRSPPPLFKQQSK